MLGKIEGMRIRGRQRMRWLDGITDSQSEQAGLKFNIQKMKVMASGPITSWQIDGEKVEIVAYFIFVGSKITMESDCSHEIKRCLFLGRKAMTNLAAAAAKSLQSCPTLCDPIDGS